MPAFSAYAPGKIILFGEHAVVYGRPAIAAPVDQVKARAFVQPNPRGQAGEVKIQAPAVNLDCRWDELNADHPLSATLHEVVEVLGIKRIPACLVRITSTIPIAAGMGSGAAVSVALIRAFSAFLGHPLPDEQVSALAYEIDKLYHGTPSGIDNTVITYAMPVYFQRGQPVETFQVATPFTIVIGDTGISSPTSASVSDVRRLWEAGPERFNRYFDEVAQIVQEARQAIETGSPESLGPLMDQNQHILQDIGVSCLELDNLIEAAHRAGALGAKLSGGGRGGNMIALAAPERAEGIAKALQKVGAVRTIITRIG